MAAQTVDYALTADWDSVNLGQFVIGYSTLDGPDTFGVTFDADFTGDYADLWPYAKSVTWSRGRQTADGNVAAGGGTIVLADRDGLFNPHNLASPLAGKLKPMRPVQLTATTAVLFGPAPFYRCFYLFIRSIEHNPDPNVLETTIELIDLFDWLAMMRPVIASQGVSKVGIEIGRVLDAVYWTNPAMRLLVAGDDITGFSADGTVSALDLIASLLVIDPGGMFFIDGRGRATYKSRHTIMLQGGAVTLDGTMSALGSGTSSDNIENRATVTSTGGTAQVATNVVSSHDYGIRDGQSVETDLLFSDGHADALARELVRLKGTPDAPMWGLELKNRTTAVQAHILSRELGQRLTVSEEGGGTSGEFVIQQMSHTLSHRGKIHFATYGLTLRDDQTPFVIGTSVFDGADQLIY